MDDKERGVFKTPLYARQLVKFTDLVFKRGITPTDIDGLIEFDDKAFVLLELKYGDTPMPYGQQLAIERLISAIENGGKPATAIIATHNESGDINAAECEVVKVWVKGRWFNEPWHRTVRMVIDNFLMTEGIDL